MFFDNLAADVVFDGLRDGPGIGLDAVGQSVDGIVDTAVSHYSRTGYVHTGHFAMPRVNISEQNGAHSIYCCLRQPET